MLDRLTQRDREDSDDDDQEMARVPKGAKGLVKVDVKTFLNPESAGIKLSLGDLTQSAREASSKTAKSLATLVRAIKQCMEASLASQADNWPLMTPRGQHLTEVYKSEVTYEEAVSQLNNSTKEIFEAYHELRGISFLAGGSAGDVQKNVQGLGRPQNAQEWKLLVATCAQATMSIAKSLRVLKQGLVRLPSDAADIDITGMRASQLEGEFGGVMQEVGVAANSTVLTLRELLSNAVDAGADPRFAPWRQADQETTLEALDAAQKSQLEADSAEETHAACRSKNLQLLAENQPKSLDQTFNSLKCSPNRGRCPSTATLLMPMSTKCLRQISSVSQTKTIIQIPKIISQNRRRVRRTLPAKCAVPNLRNRGSGADSSLC